MQNLLSVFVNVLPAIVVFGILIIVHEWGHFIACRLRGVKVEKFSIGFGPELFGWRSGKRILLFRRFRSGFVKPAGKIHYRWGPRGQAL